MSQAAPANYIWWLMSRSAGMVALLLVTASVLLGLSMAARVVPPRRKKDAVRLHEHLALLGLAAISAHGLLLLGDTWLRPGWRGIALPFAMSYRPLWTGMGIVGGYLAAVLGLSFYARKRIGARLWRRMHRLTVVVYALGLAHALGSGTDAQIPAVRMAMFASAPPVLFLFALRVARERGQTRARRMVAVREKGESDELRSEDRRGSMHSAGRLRGSSAAGVPAR
ncbi:MAG TPA: ferric reductase-like transmembrane domain-containing protein [Solirubrobacteraceae bacterium]|jgi:sulfoxide reductase heme-binding subunit YedZ